MFVSFGIVFLFFLIGLVLPKMKRNYTIGIRLPWTLHSDEVWDKTHCFGGKLFIAFSVLLAIGILINHVLVFYFLTGGIILLLSVLVVYSYWQYREIEKRV